VKLNDFAVLDSQIKLASVQLARKYMKRVTSELDAALNDLDKEPIKEFLLLQGVRFAFRVHQVRLRWLPLVNVNCRFVFDTNFNGIKSILF
jgi:hypothetical protein